MGVGLVSDGNVKGEGQLGEREERTEAKEPQQVWGGGGGLHYA